MIIKCTNICLKLVLSKLSHKELFSTFIKQYILLLLHKCKYLKKNVHKNCNNLFIKVVFRTHITYTFNIELKSRFTSAICGSLKSSGTATKEILSTFFLCSC